MNSTRILIVEDEVLIVETVKKYLLEKGYSNFQFARSYDKAIDCFESFHPDLVILDIRLDGQKTGIEVANYIRDKNEKLPIVYLSSNVNDENLQSLLQSRAAGFLSKPIKKESLVHMVEIALFNAGVKNYSERNIILYDGEKSHQIPVNSILFVRSDHIYLELTIKGKKALRIRSSLKEFQKKISNERFFQSHRSYLVNIKNATSWKGDTIFFDDFEVPISRSKKAEFQRFIEEHFSS